MLLNHLKCHCCCYCCVASVVSSSVWPHRRQPIRLHHPSDSPGKNTGAGCHFLLQCMQVKSESEVSQSYPTLSDPMDCSLPGSSVHGIFQARVLEWGATAFSESAISVPQIRSWPSLEVRVCYILKWMLLYSALFYLFKIGSVYTDLGNHFMWKKGHPSYILSISLININISIFKYKWTSFNSVFWRL